MHIQAAKEFIGLVPMAVYLYAAIKDMRTMEIPDRCHIILMAVGLVQMALGDAMPWWNRMAGLLALSVPMLLADALAKDSFGGGDIKLAGATGFLLGPTAVWAGGIMACLWAGLFCTGALLARKKTLRDTFPLGPFLALGFGTVLVWKWMTMG